MPLGYKHPRQCHWAINILRMKGLQPIFLYIPTYTIFTSHNPYGLKAHQVHNPTATPWVSNHPFVLKGHKYKNNSSLLIQNKSLIIRNQQRSDRQRNNHTHNAEQRAPYREREEYHRRIQTHSLAHNLRHKE